MKTLIALLTLLVCAACTPKTNNNIATGTQADDLYSERGNERQVQLEANYQTNYTSLAQFQSAGAYYVQSEVEATTRFLFGPLVNRMQASPQSNVKIAMHNDQAILQNGVVVVPYTYTASWLIDRSLENQASFSVPVPYNLELLNSPGWLKCTDSDPEHQTQSFYFYFWDPARPGCDQQEGQQYQTVQVLLGAETPQTQATYPQYRRMMHNVAGTPTLEMTFAFGYVEDAASPSPFTDYDAGIQEFQQFINQVQPTLLQAGLKKSNILQSEYGGSSSLIIGSRYTGTKDGVAVKVSIVAAAGVDQMYLFAKSFAHDHEAFFGWMGHSRVGSGFDADQFKRIVESNPTRYSISNDYQLIYWGGCNSYSYYTLPFFDLKGGDQNLNIISNGLPSFFSLNEPNAKVLFTALFNWKTHTSFQSIINQIENLASNAGTSVLVNVLGDENQLN